MYEKALQQYELLNYFELLMSLHVYKILVIMIELDSHGANGHNRRMNPNISNFLMKISCGGKIGGLRKFE